MSDRHILWLGLILCVGVVFWTAWPALQHPRIEGDDFRYLAAIQHASMGDTASLVEAMIVENRWDHLWFMEEEGRIRFFRPTVVASYGIDWFLWGDQYAFGLTLTNVLIHLGCCLLVFLLLDRWLGRGWPAVAAALLFAGLWSHGECIWYIAGRTDSLAALGFLAAFFLHGSKHSKLRWWAMGCFIFGLLTKELVIAAPLVFMAHDRLVEHRRLQWRLYAAYALATVLVLGLKQWVLGGVSSDWVYPYLISPFRPDFIEHLGLQAWSYSANLILAQWTAPFADKATVAAMNSLAGVGLACGILIWTGVQLRREGRFWLLFFLGGVTWLPTSFVYLSERYLYLPSVAFVGILGLWVATRSPPWRNALAVLVGIYALFHAVELRGKHREICEQLGSVRELEAQLDPLRDRIKTGGHLLLINLPGTFLRAQFAQETFQILLNDPSLKVQVLSLMPGQNGTHMQAGDPPPRMGANPVLREVGAHQLLLKGRHHQRVQEYESFPFAWSPLEAGRNYQTPEFHVHVVAGVPRGATQLLFTLPEPVDSYQIVIWDALEESTLHPWVRRANACARLESF